MRFVQLFHTDWDHHGTASENLTTGLDRVCREVDRPCARSIKDLKQRGLLDDTLVIWGGEFGRTPMGEVRDTVGRNHHIDGYTMWLGRRRRQAGPEPRRHRRPRLRRRRGSRSCPRPAGDGAAPAGSGPHEADVQFQGRDFRLTDVHGNVVTKLLA